MQKGHLLEFTCQSCQSFVCFSLFDLDKKGGEISCLQCKVVYDFGDENLKRQLKKFINLCRQIQESEEILSATSLGVYIGDREIKIPFKILLSRLNSILDLNIGNNPFTIQFRIEPHKDVPLLEQNHEPIHIV